MQLALHMRRDRPLVEGAGLKEGAVRNRMSFEVPREHCSLGFPSPNTCLHPSQTLGPLFTVTS